MFPWILGFQGHAHRRNGAPRRRRRGRDAVVLAAFSALVLTACSGRPTSPASPSPARTFSAEETARIDAAARSAVTGGISGGITGVIIGISDPYKGVYLKAYGSSDTGGTPMTTGLHYRIGSVTKTFTALAVLRLADEGKLSLDDPISKYVAGLPNGGEITVRNLLGMRGGAYDYLDPAFLAGWGADPTLPHWRRDDAVAVMKAHAQDFRRPGVRTVYDNSDYYLLGYVIEQASGQSVPDHLNALAKRLGLNETSFPVGDALPRPFAHGYGTAPPSPTGTSPAATAGPGHAPDATLDNPAVLWTAGAMISTVPDLMRYAAELGTGTGLTPETARERFAWTPRSSTGIRLQYGLGVARLGDWVGHDGSVFGYTNLAYYLPQQQATVIVMANEFDSAPAGALWVDLVRQLYPTTLPDWPDGP